MRMDYALLSRMQLQSTSDQQDYRQYPPIAVAAPMSVVPEQSASWAYPQPEMPDEHLAYAMCTGMLGRLYLSGRLDGMRTDQLQSVRDAVGVFRDIRSDLARAVPLWPLGLPGWSDPWLSLALRAGDVTYLAVWRREGAAEATDLALDHLRGRQIAVDVLYPRHLPAWTCEWAWETGSLTVTPTRPDPYSARIFRLVTRAVTPTPDRPPTIEGPR
jgi:alpha-galactosidase